MCGRVFVGVYVPFTPMHACIRTHREEGEGGEEQETEGVEAEAEPAVEAEEKIATLAALVKEVGKFPLHGGPGLEGADGLGPGLFFLGGDGGVGRWWARLRRHTIL